MMMTTTKLHKEQLPKSARDETLSALFRKIEGALNLLSAPPVEGVKTVLSNYTVQAADTWILVNAAGGAVTILLPKSAQSTHLVGVKKIDASANTVTVRITPGDMLEAATAVTLVVQWQKAAFVPNGGTLWVQFI